MKTDIIFNYYNSLEFKDVIDVLDSDVNVIVYNKSGIPLNNVPNEKMLENIGREGHTYLTHIINNYDSLSDITIFMQDDFYNHLFSKEYFINNLSNHRYDSFYQFPCSWRNGQGSVPFNRTILDGYLHLPPVSNNNAIKDFTIEFGLDLPNVYTTETCSHFLVSKELLLRHSKEKYEKILDWLLKDNSNGFVLEHCWKILFM
jgi:hypothetical protein